MNISPYNYLDCAINRDCINWRTFFKILQIKNSLTHSLTHLLIHSLTHSFTHLINKKGWPTSLCAQIDTADLVKFAMITCKWPIDTRLCISLTAITTGNVAHMALSEYTSWPKWLTIIGSFHVLLQSLWPLYASMEVIHALVCNVCYGMQFQLQEIFRQSIWCIHCYHCKSCWT